MDITRRTSPPSIRVFDPNPTGERRGNASPSSSHASSCSFSPSSGPMAIPHCQQEEAPPPLPPPPFIEDLANGHDLAWQWGNAGRVGAYAKLAPIKQSSSLYGGYMQSRLDVVGAKEGDNDFMDLDDGFDGRGSTVSTVRSPSQPEINMGEMGEGHMQQNGPKPPSPSFAVNQRLHGENPLAQESLSRSSHAYDKHLLSKIGKPNSPPRKSSLGSGNNATLAKPLPLHARDGSQLQRLSVTSVSAPSFDPISRWVSSPSSAMSPVAKHAWQDYSMRVRTPSIDDSMPSSASDSDFYSRLREDNARSKGGSYPCGSDSLSLPIRSNQGSHDQSAFAKLEADFPMEETGGMRRLNLGDSAPPRIEECMSLSKQGMKRRALSPPLETSHGDKASSQAPTPSSETFARKTSISAFPRSPTSRFHLKHGSVSSTSSASFRNNSLASSVSLSVAGSSMTSASSIERHSPGAMSPLSDLEPSQDSPYVTSVSLKPSPCTSINSARLPNSQTAPESNSIVVARRTSAQSALKRDRANNASRIGEMFICECCPKKPKKFSNEDELRIHEMEKQYTCQFCHNRFKNKNEAERHQNSLHLRRHSWSCAAIAGYQAAFHPSTSPTPQAANGPSADACGYCGEEFSNFPQRNWERRVEHLTNMHKFAECNHAKKFYRADHFRQHLKHSHAGTSGKWTNMLENACMKEEVPSDASGTLINMGEQSRGPSTSIPGGIGGKTIDEVHDES